MASAARLHGLARPVRVRHGGPSPDGQDGRGFDVPAEDCSGWISHPPDDRLPQARVRNVGGRPVLSATAIIRWLPSWGDLIQARARSSHPDPRIQLAGRARKHQRADPLLPASQATGLLPAVCAQTCGSLVRNGAEPVHTQWKCWGFRCLAATMTGPLPGKARVTSCACRENRNYPHAAPR
jgi:hypothetical protein